jgi:hypothetical protein
MPVPAPASDATAPIHRVVPHPDPSGAVAGSLVRRAAEAPSGSDSPEDGPWDRTAAAAIRNRQRQEDGGAGGGAHPGMSLGCV